MSGYRTHKYRGLRVQNTEESGKHHHRGVTSQIQAGERVNRTNGLVSPTKEQLFKKDRKELAQEKEDFV